MNTHPDADRANGDNIGLSANRRTRTQHAEGVVQVLILLTIGGMAGAASFTHVHNVAAAHGQPGWLAWADAVVLELMSIATGLEIRRRHRAAQPTGFVLAVLVGAVALSLSAQVVEAEPSVVGWLAAALPALGFLALVKIVLTRSPSRAEDMSTSGISQAVVPAVMEDQAATVTRAALARADIVPVRPETFARANNTTPTVHSGAAR
jgi:hypothetical protein